MLYDGRSGRLRGGLPWKTPLGDGRVTRAFHNSGVLTLTVKPEPRRGRVAIVACSLPRVQSGTHNFHPLSQIETKDALHSVAAALGSMGIAADLWGARLSRLDIFRNVETAEPLTCYWPIFETRDGKRVRNKKCYGGTGFLWTNSRRQYAIYDKIAQMQANGHPVTGPPANVVRFEYRLTGTGPIREALRAVSLADLLTQSEAIGSCYREAFADCLFRSDLPGPFPRARLGADSERAYFENLYGSRWARRLASAAGFQVYVGAKGGIYGAARFFAEDGAENRMRLSRYRREIQGAISDLEDARRFGSGQTRLADLERELRAKILL